MGKSRIIPLFPDAIEVLKNLPRYETYGKVGEQYFPARFVFPKCEIVSGENGKEVLYTRCDDIKRSFKTLCQRARVENLQIKDLRNWMNWILKSKYGFNLGEAAAYLGHNETVNQEHYTEIPLDDLITKMDSRPIYEALGWDRLN